MNSIGTKWVASLALGIVASGAMADTKEHQAEELARFRSFAGAPVDEFSLVNVFQTQIVGDTNVVVWPTINTAFLLTVDKPCINLSFAHGFALTQEQTMKVSKRFDFVKFDGQRCRITEIRPVDYKAMLEADKKDHASGGT
jgi:Family of unknown function (DUF6491)